MINKNTLKFYAIVILSLAFIYGFSVSYTSDSIDNISYVIALAVDESKDKQNIQVTFEFMDTSTFASESSSPSNGGIVDTVTATSINSALNLLNAYVGKSVNLSHCKVIVFSDKLAQKGLSSEISELMNNIQIRPSTNIIICKGNAMEYLQNSNSQLEKILTKYYDIFPNSSEYTGYTSNIMIGDFYRFLTTKEAGNVAILGSLNKKIEPPNSSDDSSSKGSSSEGSSSSEQSPSTGEEKPSEESSSSESNSEKSEEESSKNKPIDNTSISNIISGNAPILGERGTENIGLAVLRNGKYIGDLTAADTLCHTLISGEVNSFLLTINNTEIYKNYIDISLFENLSPHIQVNFNNLSNNKNEAPEIIVDIKLIGRINGIKNGINYSDETSSIDLDKISNAVDKALEQYMYTYLEKTTSEFKCDIDYFYNKAKRHFKTIQEWQDYDWASKYEKCKFKVNIDSKVYYSLLDNL